MEVSQACCSFLSVITVTMTKGTCMLMSRSNTSSTSVLNLKFSPALKIMVWMQLSSTWCSSCNFKIFSCGKTCLMATNLNLPMGTYQESGCIYWLFSFWLTFIPSSSSMPISVKLDGSKKFISIMYTCTCLKRCLSQYKSVRRNCLWEFV